MAKTGIQNYVNTVIFCVILKIISIVVLGLILMDYVNDKVMYFLITLELGIVVIVIAALASISSYEKRIAEETKNALKSKMNLLSCPDYFTQTAKNMCINAYTTPDGKYTYTLIGASNVPLGNYLNKPMIDACDAFNKSSSSVDPERGVVYKYPWTDMASKCDIV